MKRKVLLLLVLIMSVSLLLAACTTEPATTPDPPNLPAYDLEIAQAVEPESINVPSFIDFRIKQAAVYDNTLLLIYQNMVDRVTNKIVLFDLIDDSFALVAENQYQFWGAEKVYMTDQTVAIQGDIAVLVIDRATNAFRYEELQDPQTPYSIVKDDAFNQTLLSFGDRIEVSLNGFESLQYDQDETSAFAFEWFEDQYIAYYNEHGAVLNIIDTIEAKLVSLDLQNYYPEGLVDYQRVNWLSSSKLILTALCENGVTLQVINVATGELEYTYTFADDGYIFDIVGDTVFIMDIEERFVVKSISVADYSITELASCDEPIQFAFYNEVDNSLYFDVYLHAELQQDIYRVEGLDIPIATLAPTGESMYDNDQAVVQDIEKVTLTKN